MVADGGLSASIFAGRNVIPRRLNRSRWSASENTRLSLNIYSHIEQKVLGLSFPFFVQELIGDWLRLVIIIGGYILLRPILLRLGAKLQEKSLEKEDKRRTDDGVKEEKQRDEKAKKGLEWGANARIRQRKVEERGVVDGEESDSDELEELLDK